MAASPESIELFKLNDLIAGRHIPASIAVPNGWFEPNDKSATKKAPEKGLISGWAFCTVLQLLQQHRKEVIAIKEQLRYVRERLAA
ncbi:MAG: hypothetical protein VZR95_07100 [Alphaproteobacteria bacterium]